MTREEMISNASAIVLAGSETSATLLSGCTWLLLRPENSGRLRRLAEHVRASFSGEDEIDLISVGRLDYMLAVIDEALRLYPPVPMQSNRLVRRGGEEIAGGWVPEGVSLALRFLESVCVVFRFFFVVSVLSLHFLLDPSLSLHPLSPPPSETS